VTIPISVEERFFAADFYRRLIVEFLSILEENLKLKVKLSLCLSN
jgi:hypothetical protein